MRLFRVSDLSLQVKLPLLVGTLLLGLGSALYAAAYLHVRQEAARTAHDRLAGVTAQVAALLEQQSKGFARGAAIKGDTAPVRSYLLRGGDPTAALRALRSGREQDSLLAAIVLRDSLGGVLATSGPDAARLATLVDPGELPRAARDTGAVGRFRALGDSVYFPVIATVVQKQRPIGFVVWWNRISGAPTARGPVAQLIGSDALMLIGSPGGAWMSESGPIAAPRLDDAPGQDGLFRYERDGVPVLAAAAVVAGTPWSVAIEFPAAVITAPARRFFISTAPAGALILALGVLLAWLLGRQLTRPLAELTLATEGVGYGRPLGAIPLGRGDEVGRLGAAFARMAVRVEEEAHARELSEAQWRAVFDGSPHPKWVQDAASGRILAVNPAAVREYGYPEEEFLRLDARALEAPSATDPGAVEAGVTRHRTRKGEVIDVELTTHELAFMGAPARFVLAQNVTARNLLEARFRQAQKMQAIGRLAGGVAHDFNNFLTAIGAYAELALDGLPPESERARDIREILRAATQANRLTRQLLAFTRQQVLVPTVMELDAAVLAMGEMLKHLVRENVQVVTRLDSAHVRVTIDPGHLEQVLMNLVVNARDAMPRGGRIVIGTTFETLDAPSARLHGLEKPGRYAILSVADTGVGMSPEVRARIFEPFFTTKGVGQGTGLGLATVYGIVTQRGGHITAYSEPGVGTTFRVYLPVTDTSPILEERTASEGGWARGTETILLVEDEDSVRSAARDVLERQGYTVLTASDPHEAIALASQHGSSIDLVVSDVVMPHSDGPTVIRRIRQEQPRLKALLISGYAGDALPKIDAIEGEFPFLAKPFTVMALARKIREVLDG